MQVTGTTTVNAASVNSGGETQRYQGNVTLNTDVNFTGTTVQFDGNVSGSPNNFTVTGNAIFGDASTDSVSTGQILVTGTTTFNGASVNWGGETSRYQRKVSPS